MTSRKVFNRLLAATCSVTGSTWLYSNIINKIRTIPIIFYHEVGKHNSEFEEFSVNRDNFEKHVVWMIDKYSLLTISDLCSHIEGNKNLGNNVAAITFDGGYLGNYLDVWPVLKRYQCPATIYVITDPLDGYMPPHKRIMYLISMTKKRSCTFVKKDGRLVKLKLHSLLEKKASRKFIENQLSALNLDERETRLNELTNELEVDLLDLPKRIFCSWDQIREMSQNNLIEIGSHSVSHPRLTDVSPEEARTELRRSKERIEYELGKSISSFCYPDGFYSPEIIRLAQEAGYSSALAVSTPRVLNDLNSVGDGIYELRRICMPDDGSSFVLAAEISGLMRVIKKLTKQMVNSF